VSGMTSVVVVHHAEAPGVQRIVALCTDHEAFLRRQPWAKVDELVGFSTVMQCEACALMHQRASDASATEQDAAAMDTWEDEGGGQAARAVDERSSEPSTGRPPTPVRDNLDHLVDALDDETAVEALAYLETLRNPRLLSEAGTEDEAATEEEHDAAVEAWQLDRRHALDER
jgi:hypothetical protein